MTATTLIPLRTDDPINAQILAISEDRVQGFHRDPLGFIAHEAGLPEALVIERLRAMLDAGVIRRIRQTMLATSLADGALVAWSVPASRLQSAFDFMARDDPFSGHVVIRSTDGETAGSQYRLWTTLKVPAGYSLERHASYLASQCGAITFRLMPAKRLFALGVGHVRRRDAEPGARITGPANETSTELVHLDEHQWRVLTALKREFRADELRPGLWSARAEEAGCSLDEFYDIAEGLQRLGVAGRFSTFLEHVKELSTGERVTRYNGLFHWAVRPGQELAAGREVGRHHIITHSYWREGGPEFANVNVMAVAHGMEKSRLLEHKAAIDRHLEQAGIDVSYTNVFWGGRSEIKPSEVSPIEYQRWCLSRGIVPEEMRSERTPQ